MKFFGTIFEKYRSHPFFGKFGGAVWSATVTAAFAVYNVFLGVSTGGAWFYGIGLLFSAHVRTRGDFDFGSEKSQGTVRT